MLEKIKNQLAKLEDLEAIADRADAAYDANPEDEAIEAAFDEAYANQWSAFVELSEMIADFTGMEAKTARELIRVKREELAQILNRAC